MLRVINTKKRFNDEISKEQKETWDASVEPREATIEKKIKVNDAQEQRRQWLISVGYEGKKRAVLEVYEATKSTLVLAFDSVFQSGEQIEEMLKILSDHLVRLQEVLKDYDACLGTRDNDEKFKEFLRKKMQYEIISPFAKEAPNLMALLQNLWNLKVQLEKLGKDNLKEQITIILQKWIENPEQLESSDAMVVEQLLDLKSHSISEVNAIRTIQVNVRQLHLKLVTSRQLYTVLVDQFHEKLSSLVNANLPTFSDKDEFFEKVKEVKNAMILLNQLEQIYQKLGKNSPYQLYIERRMKSIREDIIDKKIEATEMAQPKMTTSTISTLSLFSKKMIEVAERQPVTTWERHNDTTIQENFLQYFLSDKNITGPLGSLKKDPFNISFLEYVQDGEYKVLFAISGSNDALNSEYHTRFQKAHGINDLISTWVKKWNLDNPGVTFQYVTSYNGSNLKMDEGAWYCSEPKLAIEYSKIKRNAQHRIGQNNWTVDPYNFRSAEQDACMRHCQPRQNELLEFNAQPKSPIRITN